MSFPESNDILTSPDGSFSCGFYQLGDNAFSFSIWFSNSANKTVVWTANRDRPVNGQGSRY
ncbi:putative receptor protein kinase ZmPK1 [Acorus gramineus]|uniref:Receptor protein kinase ZmPK1 n=1 Tax=Acorus gramineus TaxID=55184 RepID=A0AAV9BL79_ACOGR|nr:putative receptor protein kinase ZmPK1 [Acorus gramineus]